MVLLVRRFALPSAALSLSFVALVLPIVASTYVVNSTADLPDADLNLSYRLQQLTSIRVDPNARLLRATDPKFNLGDWGKIQKDFFSEGGIFDQIYQS